MTTLTRYSPNTVDRGLPSSAEDIGAALLKSGLVPFVLVEAGNIVAASPAVRDILGGTSPYHHIDGHRLSSIVAEPDRGAVDEFCTGLLRSGLQAELRCTLVHAGGQGVPVQISGNAIPADGGQQIVLLVTDLSAWVGGAPGTGHGPLAGGFDPITGFATHGLLLDRMKIALATARRHRRSAAVLRIALENFEPLLQALAPEAAGEVEATVAETLRNCVRDSDTVARLNGHEFVLLLSEITERDDAGVSAARVVATITALFKRNPPAQRVGAHIGVAVFPNDGTSPEQLLQAAEGALGQARRLGEGSFALAEATSAELTAIESVEYRPEHGTGFADIDAEHQDLVNRTNALVTACKAGVDPAWLEGDVRAIAQLLRKHIKNEAGFLAVSPYEGAMDLKTRNLHFLDEIECLLLVANAQSILLAIRHLRDWLEPHLLETEFHRAS